MAEDRLSEVLEILPLGHWWKLWPAESTTLLRASCSRIKEFIETCRLPVELTLVSNKDPEDICKKLATVTAWGTLTRLSLDRTDLGEAGATLLAATLKPCSSSLEYLDISRNGIELRSARSAALVKHCTSLTHLGLANNCIGKSGIWRLAASLSLTTTLVHLDLSYNALGSSGIERLDGLLSQSTNLQHLNLAANNLGTAAVRSLIWRLGDSCKSLSRLDLSRNTVANKGASAVGWLLTHCTCLSHLYLRCTAIESEGAERIVAAIHREQSRRQPDHCGVLFSLSVLDLTFNDLGDEGAKGLASLLSFCPSLSVLELEDNNFQAAGAAHIAEALAKCSGLCRLNLADNGLGTAGMHNLQGVFLLCYQLSHMNLSTNAMGDVGINLFSSSLPRLTKITHLNLSFNHIGPEGARILAGTLPQLSKLSVLNLSNNAIGHKGSDEVFRLVNALGRCPSLSELDLFNNFLTRERVAEVKELLSSQQSMLKVKSISQGDRVLLFTFESKLSGNDKML